MKYRSFEEMPVWQQAMELATYIFDITESLPKKEDYGFTSQVRRSALSVSANIAEAFGRKHTLDKLNFYYHARGSLTETKSHIIYGNKVGYIELDSFEKMLDTIDNIWKEINRVVMSLRTDKAQAKV